MLLVSWAWMYFWINNNNNNLLHLYSAFLDTQSALHSKGTISSSTTNVQHPPGWCDGSHSAPERPPHTSYRWRGDRVIKSISVWGWLVMKPINVWGWLVMKPISVWGWLVMKPINVWGWLVMKPISVWGWLVMKPISVWGWLVMKPISVWGWLGGHDGQRPVD